MSDFISDDRCLNITVLLVVGNGIVAMITVIAWLACALLAGVWLCLLARVVTPSMHPVLAMFYVAKGRLSDKVIDKVIDRQE